MLLKTKYKNVGKATYYLIIPKNVWFWGTTPNFAEGSSKASHIPSPDFNKAPWPERKVLFVFFPHHSLSFN